MRVRSPGGQDGRWGRGEGEKVRGWDVAGTARDRRRSLLARGEGGGPRTGLEHAAGLGAEPLLAFIVAVFSLGPVVDVHGAHVHELARHVHGARARARHRVGDVARAIRGRAQGPVHGLRAVGVGADASAALASSNASSKGQGDARRPDEVVSRSEARGAHRRSDGEKAPGDRRRTAWWYPSRHREDGDGGGSTGRAREEIRARSRDRRRHPHRRSPRARGCAGAGARKRREVQRLDEVSETGRPLRRARTHKRPVGTRRDVLSHCAPRVAMDGEGGGTVTRAALRGRGHLGGAGRYIEMDRMDRIRLMEEGARSLQRNHAEHLGGAIEIEDADRAHARLKRMAAFDSHNYDPTDNDLEEQALRARKRSSYHAEEKWKWGMSVIIGITMDLIAFVVDGLIDKLNAFKFGSTTGLIASRVAAFPTWLTFVSIAALYSFVAGGMVSYVAPLAAGSGIPELKTYLNGVHLKGLLRLRTIVAKLGGIAFSIGSGLIAGKEGPFVHGGGLVGGGLSAFGSHSLGSKTRKPSHFRDDASKRDFVAIGTATGVAVAFGAPIGGVLFTVEEGSSFYSSGMLWRGFLATCMGVLTTHWLMQIDFDALISGRARFGTHRDFGLYTDDEANYSRVFWWYFWEVPVFALMGALGGLLGALFVKINVKITTLRQRWIPVGKRERRHAEVVAVCVVTATIMFALTRWSPCADVPLPLRSDLPPGMTQPSFDGAHDAAVEFEYDAKSKDQIRELFFRRLYCPEGQYSRYGQLFFTPLSKSLKLLHAPRRARRGGRRQPVLLHGRALRAVFLPHVRFDDVDVRHRRADRSVRPVSRRAPRWDRS